jgi:hypothetical protein
MKMAFEFWIFAALLLIDLGIIARFYFRIRASPPYSKQMLNASGVGVAPFVVHALFFFEKTFLVLQLLTIAVIYGLCYLSHIGRLSKATP